MPEKTAQALSYLANQIMNEGCTWDEACDSAEQAFLRFRDQGFSEETAAHALYAEAARYEDM